MKGRMGEGGEDTLLRSRVRREAAARSSSPLATCTSSVAVDMATFMVSSFRLGSGESSMALSSSGSSGGLKTDS